MKYLMQGLLIASLIIPTLGLACSEDGQGGIVPQNKLRIPTWAKRNGGLTREQFDKAIDDVEHVYAPIVASMGGKLNVVRNWDDGTVNAYAQRIGTEWRVSMFGGLARHETITQDAMSLVVCHEIGHHIGGAPKKVSPWSSPWASNEGQADYWANLKCLRRVWQSENNEEAIKSMEVPAALATACGKQRRFRRDDVALCIRGGMAGLSVAKLFQALSKDPEPKFDTPDTKVVTETDDAHPATQCRLDTYFQGSLCEVAFTEDVADDDETKGTCHPSLGHKKGTRPLCWFKPSVR
jgi:hypothetical protein